MKTLRLFFSTIRTTLSSPLALAVYAVIYALLLASFFKFIWTREATLWQVFLTYTLMVLIPVEFFIYQAAIIDRVRDQSFRWRAIVIDAFKFFVVTIPVLLIAWLLYYLLHKLQLRYPAPIPATLPSAGAPLEPQQLHWASLIFATAKFVLFGVALPLATIHLWIAVAGGETGGLFAGGARLFLNRIGAALARAFGSESVLVYALGLIIFVVLPYAILFVPLNVKGNKTDFVLFVFRLVLCFIFTFIGWVITLSTLARLNPQRESTVVAPAVPAATAEAAA
jgi:hypothetical protein